MASRAEENSLEQVSHQQLDNVDPDSELRGRDVTAPKVVMGRVFEETYIQWPGGGIVLRDQEGVLYVARALVEDGRA